MFHSYLMKEQSEEWNFDIVTHSPNYRRSQRLAEKRVGMAKYLFKNNEEEKGTLASISLIALHENIIL